MQMPEVQVFENKEIQKEFEKLTLRLKELIKRSAERVYQ